MSSTLGFDAIVVGGGSAGCSLATRLSENLHRRVLLIEAGPDVRDRSSVPPALAARPGNAVWDPQFLWTYKTSLNDEVRGRILGGSGAVNGSVFLRGIPEDYDSWGSPSWSYESVLPFFKRSETDLNFANEWHGDAGPMPVHRYAPDAWLPLQRALFESAVAAGFPEKPDMNEPTGWGVGALPRNDPEGFRVSAAIGYLSGARSRDNLTVWTDSTVQRIVFDGDRAVGVEVSRNRDLVRVDGSEIVLSAGAIASPSILMESGIGDAHDLERLGIPPTHDLPGVGANMRDHPVIKVGATSPQGIELERDETQQVVLVYTAQGSTRRLDLQTLVLPEWQGNARTEARAADFVLITTLELPMSRGRLALAAQADGTRVPTFDFGYLEDEEDRRRLRYAAQLSVDLLSSESFAPFVSEVMSPTPKELHDDEAFDRWLRATLRTGQHTVGTCAMGAEAAGAVVDWSGRVHGLSGLRVADLSIVPDNIRANTNATAVMVGERMAALIDAEA